MAIISKPQIVYKGVPATFTLFKTNLVNHHIVSSNSQFSSFSKWKEVYINYVSSEGNQRIIVNFDDRDGFQSGIFSASDRARDYFIVQSLILVDLDGAVLKLNRSDLNTNDFDLELFSNSDSEEFVLLMEDGNSLLLESGEFLVLE
jgi:hypothetical protein